MCCRKREARAVSVGARARDVRRLALSEGEMIRLCDSETRSRFDRYDIIDDAELGAAVAKRFNGIVTAESEGFAARPELIDRRQIALEIEPKTLLQSPRHSTGDST